jgi:hypothetical protein
MIFHFEILDQHIDSIKSYLATQIKVSTDDITKAQRMEPMFPGGVEEFLATQLANLVEQVVTQYPDPETRAAMQQEATLKAQRRAKLAPKMLSDAEVSTRLGGAPVVEP